MHSHALLLSLFKPGVLGSKAVLIIVIRVNNTLSSSQFSYVELELFYILFNILELNKFSKCNPGTIISVFELNNIHFSLPLVAGFPTADSISSHC